jgi:Na+-transporting NADH:ubiquinone oxidoreductase subunit B
MKFARFLLDKHESLFKKGTKLESLYPLHEALDTFLFTPKSVTKEGSHVRDALDLKRMMTMVIIALGPCILMAMYNTGLQANIAIQAAGATASNDGCRSAIMALVGLGFSPESILSCLFHGALYFVPVLVVTYAVGGLWEALFSIVRKHDINEGFLVTGMLLFQPPRDLFG